MQDTPLSTAEALANSSSTTFCNKLAHAPRFPIRVLYNEDSLETGEGSRPSGWRVIQMTEYARQKMTENVSVAGNDDFTARQRSNKHPTV